MGIHGSATCVMNFDGAEGYLVGEPHKGLQAMFVMMNTARLGVGVQGLGLSRCAYQNALAYAKDALQMRAVRPEGAGQAGRPDHRAPRRAPHAADRRRRWSKAAACSACMPTRSSTSPRSRRTPPSASARTSWPAS
jgi:alkylation response protein AidB-like acyl-CoA dehydrogenase